MSWLRVQAASAGGIDWQRPACQQAAAAAPLPTSNSGQRGITTYFGMLRKGSSASPSPSPLREPMAASLPVAGGASGLAGGPGGNGAPAAVPASAAVPEASFEHNMRQASVICITRLPQHEMFKCGTPATPYHDELAQDAGGAPSLPRRFKRLRKAEACDGDDACGQPAQVAAALEDLEDDLDETPSKVWACNWKKATAAQDTQHAPLLMVSMRQCLVSGMPQSGQ